MDVGLGRAGQIRKKLPDDGADKDYLSSHNPVDPLSLNFPDVSEQAMSENPSTYLTIVSAGVALSFPGVHHYLVAAATIGDLVDCKGVPVTPPHDNSAGGTFLTLCGLLYRRGQGEADHLCIRDRNNPRQHILQECHDKTL
jgi:hypothetical protein